MYPIIVIRKIAQVNKSRLVSQETIDCNDGSTKMPAARPVPHALEIIITYR